MAEVIGFFYNLGYFLLPFAIFLEIPGPLKITIKAIGEELDNFLPALFVVFWLYKCYGYLFLIHFYASTACISDFFEICHSQV